MEAFVNPNIFIFFLSDRAVLWDFESHNQYCLKPEYVNRLLWIVENREFNIESNIADAEFFEANIVSNLPFKNQDWGWDFISRIFHVGTKDVPLENIPGTGREWAEQYTNSCIETLHENIPPPSDPEGQKIALPEPDISVFEKNTLWDSLKGRKSCRTFHAEETSVEILSSVIYAAFGFIRDRSTTINEFVPKFLRQRRSSPSGGGLNATEVYLFVLRVQSLRRGIYHYDPEAHALTFLREIGDGLLGQLLLGQYFANDLSYGVFLTSRFDRMWWKYKHSRAYRVSLLEIGHLSQTFQLCATATGMKTWLSAAFQDKTVEEVLGLTNANEQPMLFVGAGYSNGDDLDVEMRKLLTESSGKLAHD